MEDRGQERCVYKSGRKKNTQTHARTRPSTVRLERAASFSRTTCVYGSRHARRDNGAQTRHPSGCAHRNNSSDGQIAANAQRTSSQALQKNGLTRLTRHNARCTSRVLMSALACGTTCGKWTSSSPRCRVVATMPTPCARSRRYASSRHILARRERVLPLRASIFALAQYPWFV